MLRIESGTVDQVVYFDAGAPGLSGFTVYRARNGAAAAAMTTPTVTEVDATNMPGVYSLLLDEDMTIGAGNTTEAMVFHVSAAGMSPKVIEVELFVGPSSADVLAIKSQTDKMTFTLANRLDVNTRAINGTVVNGNGGTIPWGP